MAINTHDQQINNQINDDYMLHINEKDNITSDATWKTSYFGLCILGAVSLSSFHCMYSLSAIVSSIILTLNINLFQFGLIYTFHFIGIGIGIFFASYLLNTPTWINESQMIAKSSIFVVFVTQFISAIIFLYAYEYINHTKTSPDILLYIALIVSRFIMGIAIGCIELSVNNLVYEWFSDNAFNAKLSDNPSGETKQYLQILSSRVLLYCLCLKESGHILVRLICVPLVYLTFSNNTNLCVTLFVGVILSGLSWCLMVYVSYIDRQNNQDIENKSQRRNSYINGAYNDEISENDSESSFLIHTAAKKHIADQTIIDEWSYAEWYNMEFNGLNKSVVLSIIFLSINFSISFSFTILTITNFVQLFEYKDYGANLLICLIPIWNIFGSNYIKKNVLSKVNSVWAIMFIGCILYVSVFGLLAFICFQYDIFGANLVWLPIICVIIFIFASECLFSSGYQVLLLSSPQYVHGLICGINSSANFILSGIFMIIFSWYMHYAHYGWSYAFCCFISIINLMMAIMLRNSSQSSVQEL